MINFGKQKTLFSALAKFSASAKKCNVDACVYPAAGRLFLICLFGWQWPPSPIPICFAIAILDQHSFLWRWSHSQAIERQIGCTQLGYWLQWIVSLRAFLSKLDDFPVLSSSTSCHCQCHAGALKKLRGNVRANKLLPARNPQLDKIAQIGLTWGSEQIYQQNDSIPKETRPVKYPTRGEVVIPMNLNMWYFWKSPFCVWTGDEVSANTGFNWLENEVCLYLQ